MKIKQFNQLNELEKINLQKYIDNYKNKKLPYHTLDFIKVIDNSFNYKNFSLVAIDDKNKIKGFVPQWQKGNTIESVPWRDKGGPLFDNDIVLSKIIENTKKIVENEKLKGFIWRDFECEKLKKLSHQINVDIDLSKFDTDKYWNNILSKVRTKIKKATKNGLIFNVENIKDIKAINNFYKLFELNRKRLGVPVYSKKLFLSYFKYFKEKNINLFNVYKDKNVVASFILLNYKNYAIDAYSATNHLGLKLKASDFIVYNVINYCIKKGIKNFDFGADSPMQESLISFKLKWLGEKRKIISSYWGNVIEMDHNDKKYDLIKKVIRKMPLFIYRIFSRLVVR